MATYKNINGTNIPIRASDPTNPILGEIWYNTTSNTLKGQGYGTASWATAPVMNEARAATASFGTQTSGVAATGLDVPITNGFDYESQENLLPSHRLRALGWKPKRFVMDERLCN